jgi:hypothetical protein
MEEETEVMLNGKSQGKDLEHFRLARSSDF